MRRIRKRFKRPKRPWDSEQIKEEKKVLNKYGLRRKRELWTTEQSLRRFRQRARELIAQKDAEKEKVLLDRLVRLGLLSKEKHELDDVLALGVENMLERRLQTIVFKKGAARTPLQARQMIVHGSVMLKGRRMSFPSYIVPVDEEPMITFKLGATPKPSPKKQEAEDPADQGVEDTGVQEEAKAEKPEPKKEEPNPEEKSEDKPAKE